MTTYEFQLFADPAGVDAEKVLIVSCVNDKDAIKHARELAATRDGAVDVGRTGADHWNARYITTAKREYDPFTESNKVSIRRID